MQYEFMCQCACPGQQQGDEPSRACQAAREGKVGHFLIDYPIGKAPDLGATVPCPLEGCTGRVVRILSLPQVIVRGTTHQVDPQGSGDMMTTRINGEQINFRFIDHPHQRAPDYQTEFNRLARSGKIPRQGLGSAYIDAKTGKPCVQVVSNVPDPLGKMQEAKKKGDWDQKVSKVNQGYKVRPKHQRKPGGVKVRKGKSR